jgi:mannosyltransferase OCH1-like enzyme
MQLRNIGTPLLILTVAAGFALWISRSNPFLQACDLFQCVRTYYEFPKLHPDFFNYPICMPTKPPAPLSNHTATSRSNHTAPAHSNHTAPPYSNHTAPSHSNDTKTSKTLVPKRMHQILLNEHHFHDDNSSNRFNKYESARKSCIDLHRDWDYKLWTEENATDWVRQHYPEKKYPFDDTPEVYQPYLKYRQTIQRTNILSYLLLHHYGGVYLDVDITCRVNLDPFLNVSFLTPAAHPAGINNAFILSRPRHPFLTELIEQIPKHNLTWPFLPYVENMLSTGCMFISNVWIDYMRHNSTRRPEDKVYILADQCNNTKSHMLRGTVTTPLFDHGGESSWHGKDARFMFWMDKHWKAALAGLLIFFFVSAAFLTFLLVWRRPCWLGGRCRDRGHCRWEEKKPRRIDEEYYHVVVPIPEAYDDPNSLASNVAMHSTSAPESDAYTVVRPSAVDGPARASSRRAFSGSRSVAESVASDATIRPADGRAVGFVKQ